ncbi:MAG: beta-lactamase family protein [Acidimicrobiales bacterium]|nr:beta-lactamase family protein [Acidimicrobiales bacterium]MCB1014500.1 beta-lactamase family protein [Acidimicrobiales bacterium]MCB9372123.1 beta-lactamase family protein [Microthrixaceae bacterium]
MAAELDAALAAIDGWPVPHAAVVVVGPEGVVGRRGAVDRRQRVASVTKVVTALATWVAVEEEAVRLDEPAGPPGATVAHLLAHASGLAFDRPVSLAPVGARRIYSNVGFDRLGEVVAERSGLPFARYLHEAVLAPLAMADSALEGSPAKDLWSTAADLARLAAELLRPTLVHPATLERGRSVAFPGLAGVLPGIGAFDPLDWGLGVEVKGTKHPHWSGTRTSPATFGHFGGAGTFLWIDPERDLAALGLSGREFGPWAMSAWPALSDAVIGAVGPR